MKYTQKPIEIDKNKWVVDLYKRHEKLCHILAINIHGEMSEREIFIFLTGFSCGAKAADKDFGPFPLDNSH